MGDEIQMIGQLQPRSTLTTTTSELVAREIIEAIDQLAARIPRLQAPHAATARRARRHRTTPKAFISSAIAAVEALSLLQAVRKFDVDEARSIQQFEDAFMPVIRRLEHLLASLKYTIEARRAAVADSALQIYQIAKGVARDPNSADVAAHVQFLKRDLGRKGRGNKRRS